jgi:hypothetical protein
VIDVGATLNDFDTAFKWLQSKNPAKVGAGIVGMFLFFFLSPLPPPPPPLPPSSHSLMFDISELGRGIMEVRTVLSGCGLDDEGMFSMLLIVLKISIGIFHAVSAVSHH